MTPLWTAVYTREQERLDMLQKTISEIEQRLGQSGVVKEEDRAALLKLLGTLKEEIEVLSRTDKEQAQSIVGFTQISAHEATRDSRDPKLLKLSLEGLSSSVSGFEKTHPKLVALIDSICTTLSNLGI
jgi:hypothetical protein